ncbi:MAG: anti-toxin [Alphaproteobacteria bacterium]|nr:anti-toxin [Alphaproteobacteria bacterium]
MKSESAVIRISQALNLRLDELAAKTGRKKSYYASRAIAQYLEDLEDYYEAREALKNSKRSYSLAEAARKLGLDG